MRPGGDSHGTCRPQESLATRRSVTVNGGLHRRGADYIADSFSCFRVFVVAFGLVDLTNKVALITGGRRIGMVVAGELAARGVDVALAYARSRAEAEQAAGPARAAGPGGRRRAWRGLCRCRAGLRRLAGRGRAGGRARARGRPAGGRSSSRPLAA